jgi:uncharacterized protein (DUF1778 family)
MYALHAAEDVLVAELSVTLLAKVSRYFIASLDQQFAANVRMMKAMEHGLARR